MLKKIIDDTLPYISLFEHTLPHSSTLKVIYIVSMRGKR